MKSAQQAKAAEVSFDEQKIFTATKEDLEQKITDILVVMQRHVLVIQKAPSTEDVPLLQYSDTTVDVPVAKDAEKTPQEQHEDCMTKYNEIQMDKKLRSAQLRTENKKQNVFHSESRSDLSFTGVSPCRRTPRRFTEKPKEKRRSIVPWRRTSQDSRKHVD